MAHNCVARRYLASASRERITTAAEPAFPDTWEPKAVAWYGAPSAAFNQLRSSMRRCSASVVTVVPWRGLLIGQWIWVRRVESDADDAHPRRSVD